MSDISKNQELDWDNMANPVPMNLIDSDFPEAELPPEITYPTPSTVSPEETLTHKLDEETASQALAYDEAKLKIENEEAAQRERLEQWMVNARARLQMADEQTAVQGRPYKPHREASPSLIRLTESQKTIFDAGEETVPGFERDSGYRTGKISLDATSDPMATIIVPRDTFTDTPEKNNSTEKENLDHKTAKLKAFERRVAKIKLAESRAETLIMAVPHQPNKANVRFAVWIMAGITPIVIGLGLFALMKTGYLDSVEDLFASITGKVSHSHSTPIATPVVATPSETIPVKASPVARIEAAPSRTLAVAVLPAPVPTTLPEIARLIPKSDATKSKRPAPIARFIAPEGNRPSPAPEAQPITPVAPVAPAPSYAATLAAKSLARARLNAEASMAGIQVAKPTFHNETATSANGETVLKANVQAALIADAENMQGMYERFAMGAPGLIGDVIIGITVLPNGHIVEGNVSSSSIGNPTFDQELLRKVLDWNLPAFPDNRPRYVAVPFHFQPRDP